jgi:hypothetical protein
MDATFATNDKKVRCIVFLRASCVSEVINGSVSWLLTALTGWLQFPLFTMMVFDEWQNGVPVAFVITACQRQPDLALWMHKVKAKMLAAKAE